MKKFLIVAGVAVALLLILGFVAKFFVNQHDKSFSPEEEVAFTSGDLNIRVFYNRPFKKGREIFGGLVPYDKVWRTGANEATTLLVFGRHTRSFSTRGIGQRGLGRTTLCLSDLSVFIPQ